jgi:hypothetical protein
MPYELAELNQELNPGTAKVGRLVTPTSHVWLWGNAG